MSGGTTSGPPDRARPGTDGWSTRGYLPHFDGDHVVHHVTIRLADSLPADAVSAVELRTRLEPPGRRARERTRRLHEWVDAGIGCCVLREPAAARLVEDAIRHFDGRRYDLLAWVVMPNHVHVVLEPAVGWRLAPIVGTWKSFTGRRLAPLVRRIIGDPGRSAVWHREHWDRYARDARHLDAMIRYVEGNPVTAGLAATPASWPWGSAACRASGSWLPRGGGVRG